MAQKIDSERYFDGVSIKVRLVSPGNEEEFMCSQNGDQA
jgi:hypothetical protein